MLFCQCHRNTVLIILFYIQFDTLHWSADGTFFYTTSDNFWKHKAPDVITWTIHHGNQPTSTPGAKRSLPLYSTKGDIHVIVISFLLYFCTTATTTTSTSTSTVTSGRDTSA
ncbi:hypothetical protein DPMN_019445 [Dreissena polymorpha]|uniref:Uncharacterized protein n=1 Tax=Dreissena polymorpha TaxID=45954 RepID=A0A9D4NKF6_DREPO|nr:hypothetical protein DPMN_019445 [Dreissena polymorpha]